MFLPPKYGNVIRNLTHPHPRAPAVAFAKSLGSKGQLPHRMPQATKARSDLSSTLVNTQIVNHPKKNVDVM